MKIAHTRAPLSAAPLKAIISVHGNVAEPEYPEQIDEVSRKGWGATFWGKEATTNWFHIPFAVPNLLDGVRPKLSRVFLYFHNTSRSPITSVHLYDGTKLLRGFDQLTLFGDHARSADRGNTFNLETPTELSSGLGVSVSVAFPQDSGEKPPRWILFTAAVAEFRA
jgi:hypothetical protein